MSDEKIIYFDNAATTQLDGSVFFEMERCYLDNYGNASSLHSKGILARDAIEQARLKFSKYVGCSPDEIIFTSGGSESNNFAIRGFVYENSSKGKHIVTSSIEHASVIETCNSLKKEGFEVSFLPVDFEGFINLKKLEEIIRKDTILVSIIHANNEIGTIQNLKEIGKICKEKNVAFHTDAVQSLSKTHFSVKDFNLSLASFSGHKIHGPKGVGALYLKRGNKLKQLVYGGQQEFGKRAGTENVAGIVGFSKSLESIGIREVNHMVKLRDYFIDELLKISNTKLNGPKEGRLCNNINISFIGKEGESLLMKLDKHNICVSTGSACNAVKKDPSHVLKAIGLSKKEYDGSIRFSLSKFTTKEEIDYTLDVLKKLGY